MSTLTSKEIKNHIVDLRRSEWDKERSDRKKGRYYFTKKVYVKTSDYSDASVRPDYVFQFVGYKEDDPQSGYAFWQMHYGAEPVLETDEFWPEPLVPNADGKYIFIDSILVKIPLEAWVDKVIADRGKYDKSAKGLQQSFQDTAKAAGAGRDDFQF